jgi:hypothetical protein
MTFEKNNYVETEMVDLFNQVKEKTGKGFKEICLELGVSASFYSNLKNGTQKITTWNKKYYKERLKEMLG